MIYWPHPYQPWPDLLLIHYYFLVEFQYKQYVAVKDALTDLRAEIFWEDNSKQKVRRITERDPYKPENYD